MRGQAGLLLLLTLAAPCLGGGLPDPLFWGSEAELLEEVEVGQFDPHLELHLMQYAADPAWRAEWAARRYSGTGLFGEYGSTTARQLHVSSQLALNVFALDRLQIRYDRRDYQDGRFDVADQRFEVIWYPGARWGIVVSGWPAHEKETASMGAGIRLGAPRSANGLVLQVVADRFLWNEKASDSLRFTRAPVRLIGDGYLERGPFTFSASIDYGLEYEAVESANGGTGRTARGSQGLVDLSAGYASRGWVVSGRVSAAWLDRTQTMAGNATSVLALDRSWARLLVGVRQELGAWSASVQAGYARQRDRFDSPGLAGVSRSPRTPHQGPGTPDGSYRADTALVGLEGGRRLGKALELRLGYLGSVQRAERIASATGSLLSKEENGYVDKAHLRALYTFQPRLSVEVLVSQTVNGSRFGGGSVKARLVF